MSIRDSLAKFVVWALKIDSDDLEVFNVNETPVSPVDGISVDRINRILGTAHRGAADELFALYADIMSRDTTFIAGSLQRQGPLIARATSVIVPPKSNPEAEARRDWMRAQWSHCKGKRQALSHLLKASALPVTLCRKIWREAPAGSGRYYDLAELRPVPFWHLTFQADSTAPVGVLKVKIFRPDGSWTGRTELPDAMNYVIHRGHLMQDLPDCWGGPMRAVVFWWYFATWARQAAANHLEGHNSPKWVAKYPKVDSEKGKRELLRAFNRAKNTTALVVPEDAKIEAIATLKSDTADAFDNFIKLCQREIAKVVIVQTLTLEAQSQGMGSNQSKEQGDQLDSVREFDSALLSETIEEQVFRPLLDLNGMSGGIVPNLSWAADDDDAQVKADMLNDLHLAGIRVKEEGLEKLSQVIGLPLEHLPESAPEGPPVKEAAAQFMAGFLAGRRVATFDAVTGPAADAHRAIDSLAEGSAADLAEAFGADFAELSRALREATGPDDLLRRLQPAVAGLEPHRAARLMEDVLATSCANGFACGHGAADR